ncbi:butyrate kinase [Syntrophotalea acetylenica]|uniref:Probable butyrate kinase n=1 Tax=Syntrophotalea acetylenica TaxID=29542 RepID=A0A1L3GDD4_SYNAC|nr:butyrate kinase [Syntrophotalea acetylenica]APG23953.1 butyrate kinase [Syntrophotalea acetylenica]APG44535.1 butyrate kinase [Syntrophotalea acetylenica]
MSKQSHSILAINPGSTSTKVSLFKDLLPVIETTINHSAEELEVFERVLDQYEFRIKSVISWLDNISPRVTSLDAVVGRGGLLPPLKSGTYAVNGAMLDDIRSPKTREHASNLGALIANEIGSRFNAPVFTVDPVSVDEFEPVARLSGLAGMERKSFSHALNIKAVARRAAESLCKKYQDINLIVGHLGGGISITAHRKGSMVDVSGGMDAGPFSPERCGALPVFDVIDMCYSGIAKEDLKRKLSGKGGMVSYLGTNSGLEIDEKIKAGDKEALLVMQAMAYQIAKEIGSMAPVLNCDVDAIVLTGGIARWQSLVEEIKPRVECLAEFMVFPGENEMLSLAEGSLRVLCGEEVAKEYVNII